MPVYLTEKDKKIDHDQSSVSHYRLGVVSTVSMVVLAALALSGCARQGDKYTATSHYKDGLCDYREGATITLGEYDSVLTGGGAWEITDLCKIPDLYLDLYFAPVSH